jgi:inner membrane protease subunit 2
MSFRKGLNHPAFRDVLYVAYQPKSLTSCSRFAAWIPVGVFFTRHGYSLATITGNSMQVCGPVDLTNAELQADVQPKVSSGYPPPRRRATGSLERSIE